MTIAQICALKRCGRPFTAETSRAVYCSATCRSRARRERDAAPVSIRPALAPLEPDRGIVETVRAELEAAGKLRSSAGQSAMLLAERMAERVDTGSALASLDRQLAERMSVALAGAEEPDLLDEMKARRDAKRARATTG